MEKKPTYFLDLFGCAKNQVDGEMLMAFLNQAGWEAAQDTESGDIIIINSCGFIESAKQESINAVLAYRQLYPEKKILLAGCLAARYPQELAESLSEADAFLGNADLSQIVPLMETLRAGGNASKPAPESPLPGTPLMETLRADGNASKPAPESPLPGTRPLLSLPGSAYVKISEGCNNRCTYCAIPLIRGPLRCRSIPDIIAECQSLYNRGIRELCLVGQDLGAYQSGAGESGTIGQGLGELLASLSALEGDFWVRLLYIHPDHISPDILEYFVKDQRLLPYFDLPFQHGSQKILHAMGRQGSAERYLELIQAIRQALPDSAIRSTFMTGFPGETEEDFQALLDFQAQANLDWAGFFAYSREEGTPAYNMKRQVPKKLAAKRKRILEERQTRITETRMERFVGKTLPVLVEERIEAPPLSDPMEEQAMYLGRLAIQAPEVDGAAVLTTDQALPLGTIIQAKVIARNGVDLELYL